MDAHDTQTLPPPPADDAPPPPRPLLRRATADSVIGGVCGGLGRRYGIDPSVLRVAFVVAVLAGGVGLFGYAALWLLVPRDTDPDTGAFTRSLPRLVLGSLVTALGLAAVLGWLRSLGGLSGVIVGGFLVGLAIWLYNRRPGPAAQIPTDTAPAAPPPVGFAYGGTGTGTGIGSAAQGPVAPAFTGAGPASAPLPRPQRSYLGLITLLIAAMAAGLVGVVAATGLIPVGPVAVLAVVLAVIAGGLLVGAFYGRARWLVIPGLLVALALPPTALIADRLPEWQRTVDAGIGERVWTPSAAGADYALGVGSATLDLSRWAASPQAAPPTAGDTISARVDLGELIVVVPRSWRVVVDARVDLGQILLDGEPVPQAGDPRSERGQSYRAELPAADGGDAAGTLALDLRVGTGELDVRRADAPAPPSPAERSPTNRGAGGADNPAAGSGTDRPAAGGRDTAERTANTRSADKENQR